MSGVGVPAQAWEGVAASEVEALEEKEGRAVGVWCTLEGVDEGEKELVQVMKKVPRSVAVTDGVALSARGGEGVGLGEPGALPVAALPRLPLGLAEAPLGEAEASLLAVP